jgi:hypothetical protein
MHGVGIVIIVKVVGGILLVAGTIEDLAIRQEL